VTQLAEWWKNIPPAMKQHKQFMVSGTDKAPINPSTGYLAAKNDPRNWLKFGDAAYHAEENDWYLGWVTHPDDPYTIIDIDNKPGRSYSAEDEELRNQLLTWALENTYVERSISGLGYHIVVEGRLPADINRGKTRGLEAYSNGGYVILTGNVVSRGTEIANGHDLCNWLVQVYRPSEADSEDYYALDQRYINSPDPQEVLKDQQFIDWAAQWRNHDKIEFLFEARDTGADGRGGSEGDLALMQMFVKFSIGRDHPDECAMRMFCRSPRGKKLGRKNGQWTQYIMRTLLKAKHYVQHDLDKQIDFSVGADALFEQFRLERQRHVEVQTANVVNRMQGYPISMVPPFRPKHQFNFQTPLEVANRLPVPWAVENVYRVQSVNLLYGWSGVGKSFVAIDLMFHVAEGAEWFGHETMQMDCTYLALEGSEGMRERVRAYWAKSAKELPHNIDIYEGKFDLLNMELVAAFVESRLSSGKTGGMIFLDTLARAIAGANENDAGEMGNAMKAAEYIRDKLQACVVIIHHSGKPDRKTNEAPSNPRGSGAITAGVDGQVEVYINRDENGQIVGRHINMNKVRDGEGGRDHEFRLQTQKLEQRQRKNGQWVDVTSCSVVDLSREQHMRDQPPPMEGGPGGFTDYSRDIRTPKPRSKREANQQAAGRINWRQCIYDALIALDTETHGTTRGQHGAPAGCAAFDRDALKRKVMDLANPDDPSLEAVRTALNTALKQEFDNGVVDRSMVNGKQFFWLRK
jgi:AAA domain